MNLKLKNATSLYLEGIRDGNAKEAVTKYTGERYTQHSTGVKDGKEGFIEFFEPFMKRNSDRDIQIIRSIVDENYVFLHVYQNINNGEAEWVTTDFFDTDSNDKIIEHWDVIAPYCKQTPSGNTSMDGETKIKDLDKTEENKLLIKNMIETVLFKGGDASKLSEYISEEKYIQHNNEVADGLDAFKKEASVPNRPLNYLRIVLLVGQGNFVATLCETNWKDDKIDQNYAQVDIFRIENGKIVEHWDNVEAVPENDVNSGKF